MPTHTPQWRKSSRSTDTGGECVELAALPEGVGIRDSKNPKGGYITADRGGLKALVAHIKQL